MDADVMSNSYRIGASVIIWKHARHERSFVMILMKMLSAIDSFMQRNRYLWCGFEALSIVGRKKTIIIVLSRSYQIALLDGNGWINIICIHPLHSKIGTCSNYNFQWKQIRTRSAKRTMNKVFTIYKAHRYNRLISTNWSETCVNLTEFLIHLQIHVNGYTDYQASDTIPISQTAHICITLSANS